MSDEEINQAIHEQVFGAKWYCGHPTRLERYPHLKKLRWLYADSEAEIMLRQKDIVLAVGDEQPDEVESITKYSTDISAAFKVVEKMQEKGFSVRIDTGELAGCSVLFYDSKKEFYFEHEFLPKAICLAALEAVKN